MQIVFEPYGSAELKDALSENLALFNVAATGMYEHYPVAFFVKTDAGEMVGGLAGHIWGGWLHVDLLWVADFLRGQGYGSKMLARAEALALERGCHSVNLNTHSFQAPEFYLQRGYQVFAVLEDSPTDHQRIYLRKSLRPVRD